MSTCTCLPYQDGGPCPSCLGEAKLDQRDKRIAELERELNRLRKSLTKEWVDAERELAQVRAENERLKEALASLRRDDGCFGGSCDRSWHSPRCRDANAALSAAPAPAPKFYVGPEQAKAAGIEGRGDVVITAPAPAPEVPSATFTNVLGQQVPKVNMHEHQCCPCGGLRWSACATCGQVLDCRGCADCAPTPAPEPTCKCHWPPQPGEQHAYGCPAAPEGKRDE